MLKSPPMRVLLSGILISAISFAIGVRAAPQNSSAQANASQSEKSLGPKAIKGCYDLTLSPWFPPMRLGDDEGLITPPPRIQLFAEKGTQEQEIRGYLVRAAPGAKPSIHSSTYWVPKGQKSLEITFTDGFSGVVLALKTADAETLHGKATTFWDFDRKRQTAEVMARRVPCGRQ